MIDLFAAIEGSSLAGALRRSVWVYPLVNAGHIFGIALLIGAVVPMDLRSLGLVGGSSPAEVVRLLRPFAVCGAIIAIGCGLLLFSAQATEYAASLWFRGKMSFLLLALLNAALHLASDPLPRRAAILSLFLWPLVLISGRMVGYS